MGSARTDCSVMTGENIDTARLELYRLTGEGLLKKDGVKKVIVNFERPTEAGFDSVRCELPDYKWTDREGYSDEEIEMFEKLLHRIKKEHSL